MDIKTEDLDQEQGSSKSVTTMGRSSSITSSSRSVYLFILLVVLIVTIVKAASDDQGNPEVCAKCGCVIGLTSPAGDYESFLGLPYARPPTKRYRFQVRGESENVTMF